MNIYRAYRLGCLVEYLGNSIYVLPVVKTRKSTQYIPILDAFREIRDILDHFKIEGLIDDKVYYWTNRLKRDYRSNQTISERDAEELSAEAVSLDELLEVELVNHLMLGIIYNGVLNIDDLLIASEGRRSVFFDAKIWKKLPKIAKSDFSEGAICLLAGAFTPAAMVCMRGMEEIIKKYYRKQIGDPKRKRLYDLIGELKKLPKANRKLLGYLDFIRAEKRNFAAHPNKIFTQEEAERIFMHIVNAVHDIYSEIENE